MGTRVREATKDTATATLTKKWRQKVGHIPDAESVTFRAELHSAGNPVEVHLSLDDHDQLLAAAEKLKTELRRIPGVFDISDSFLPGKRELQMKLKPAARSLGLTLDDLARQVMAGHHLVGRGFKTEVTARDVGKGILLGQQGPLALPSAFLLLFVLSFRCACCCSFRCGKM